MTYVNLASLTKQNRAAQIISNIGAAGVMNFYSGVIPASPDFAPTGTLLAALPLSTPAGVASLAVQGGSILTAGSGGTDGLYTLSITGGGGTGAAGTFTVYQGALSSIAISNNGNGYTSPPTFGGFSIGGLSGATATAIMTGILVFNTITSASGIATGVAGFVRVSSASAAFTGAISTTDLTISGVSSGVITIGQLVLGSGVIAGTIITSFVSGTMGGSGIYTVNNTQSVSTEPMTASPFNGVGIIDMDVGMSNSFSVVMNNTFISNGGSVSCSADVLIEQ